MAGPGLAWHGEARQAFQTKGKDEMTTTYLAAICGTSPLLMHRFAEPEEVGKQTRRIAIGEADPRLEAEKGAYRDSEGSLCLPSAAFARLLREAGSNHKQRGSRKSLKYIVPAAVLLPDEWVVMRDADGNALTDFEVDSRPIVIPSTKGRVMRHRPRLNRWHAEFAIEIDEDVLDAQTIHVLLVDGSQKIGVGDFRPERGGSFGRFQVVRWAALARREPVLIAAE